MLPANQVEMPSPPHTHTASPAADVLSPHGAFATSDEPTLTQHYAYMYIYVHMHRYTYINILITSFVTLTNCIVSFVFLVLKCK